MKKRILILSTLLSCVNVNAAPVNACRVNAQAAVETCMKQAISRQHGYIGFLLQTTGGGGTVQGSQGKLIKLDYSTETPNFATVSAIAECDKKTGIANVLQLDGIAYVKDFGHKPNSPGTIGIQAVGFKTAAECIEQIEAMKIED